DLRSLIENLFRQNTATKTDREGESAIEWGFHHRVFAKTRLQELAQAVAGRDSSWHEAASRRRASPPDQAFPSRCPASTVYQCKTQPDGCCPLHRPVDCERFDRPTKVGNGRHGLGPRP